MKPSISKKTQKYLASLAAAVAEEPQYYYSQLDELDKLIYTKGLRVHRVIIEKELNLIIVLLNSGKIIKRHLSDFPLLANATEEQLLQFEQDGLSIHWPELDEDLSLKGFLRYEWVQLEGRFASP